MSWDDSTAEMIATVYDAVDEDVGWEPLIEQLADVTGASGGHIFVTHSDGTFSEKCLWGYDDSVDRNYQAFFDRDPRIPLALERPGEIISDAEFLSDRFFENTAIYNDLLKQADVRYSVASMFPVDDEAMGATALLRPKSMGGFGTHHVEYLGHMLPHIARVLKMQERMRQLERHADDLVAALDRLPTAALIVSEKLGVVCANGRGERLLQGDDSLRSRGGKLVADRPSDTNQIQAALRESIRLADGMHSEVATPPKVVEVTRVGKPPLRLLFAPLRPRYRVRRRARRARVLVLVYDPARQLQLDAELVERIHGLTYTEAQVATALAEGLSLAEIAQMRRCAEETVRSHIKRIFKKTGTNRQGELVKLVLASPVLGFQES